MKINFNKIHLMLLAITPFIFTQSCAPNIARTNARIEDGMSGNFDAVYARTSKDSRENKGRNRYAFEGDIQYGSRNENNFGFATQAKLGLLSFPSLDLYMELPSDDHFCYGFGAELGITNGGYVIGTYYPSDKFFITVTGRIMYSLDKYFVYNPQLSFGWNRSESELSPISLFIGYDYFTGHGLDLTFNGFGDTSTITGPGHVQQMIQAGIQLGF